MANNKKPKKTNKENEKKIEETISKIENQLNVIEMQDRLKERIEEKRSSIKEDLQNQLIAQKKFGKQFDDMIEDYLYFVELKEKLQHDINENGIRYKTTGGNGFTSYKANESCERLIKTNAQMLKILQELEMKAPEQESNGDDDNGLL